MDRDREEQDFLHSLATPLGTAVFLADVLLESTKNNEIDANDPAQIQIIAAALSQMCKLLQDRRDHLAKKKQT